MMCYTPAALRMLDCLGISLHFVIDRNLQEFIEVKALELAEVDANARKHLLLPIAAEAWRQLKFSAGSCGVDIHIISAFRSVERQAEILKVDSEMSYPINNAAGYGYEPWHWRFRQG